jgi:class 3 adenylate cyclase
MAERARKEYLAAYALQRDPYPGINAATLSMLLGDHAAARALAQEIAARLAAQTTPRTCWDHATAGEAYLLLGQLDQARQCYTAAYREAPGDAGSVATMRRQVNLLVRVIPEAAELLQLLPAPDVVAFAGHMIDQSDRMVPRFPAALAPAVEMAIREHLARLHEPVVYTSAACGADLIFIEAALERGAEVNVVLPFDRQDFVRTSVAVGGDGWTERFNAALSRATRVIMATEESHLGDDVLFEHAALLLEGLASLRASQLQTSPSLLCVIDAAAAGRVGGTLASFERWQRCVGPPQVIDLGELRTRAGADTPARAVDTQGRPTPIGAPSGPNPPAAPEAGAGTRPQRTLKTMLFADFAGYSRLHDAFAPLFQTRFLELAEAQIEASPAKPFEAKTWGDALYVVFESPQRGAEFALRLLDSMLAVDWTAVGLPDTSQIRIALHAGPVFCAFDPIMGRDSYFGSSVTRTARIEPVTPPGMVYASEAFAATLVATGQDDYALEYVGRLALAKSYGESRIYRLDRR